MDNAAPKIGWRYYGRFNQFGTPGASLWDAPNAIQHIYQPNAQNTQCTGLHWQASDDSIVTTGPQRILTDIQKCDLRAVNWVVPDGKWSDHAGNTGDDLGPSWVAAIYNSVGGYDLQNNCGYWNNTVILVTWDDWGGWYDHVDPDPGHRTGYFNGTGGQYVYGFRVPLLAISTYSKPGYISGTLSQGGRVPPYIHDFGSILRFVETVFGISVRIDDVNHYDYADAQAPDAQPACQTCPYSLSDFFNFNQQPLPFQPVLNPKKPASYFVNYYSNGNLAEDPDNDADESN